MLKVGIIGCGGIAHAHADGWLAAGDLAKVTAVCDVDPGNRAKMAEKVGGAEGFTDWSEMLASNLDAVDICLPHHLHKAAIVAAADAGSVLCEAALHQPRGGRRDRRRRGAAASLSPPTTRSSRRAFSAGSYWMRASSGASSRSRRPVLHISRDQQTWGWRARDGRRRRADRHRLHRPLLYLAEAVRSR